MSDWQVKQLRRLYEFGEKIYKLDKRGEYPLIRVDDNFCRMLGYEQEEVFEICRNKARELIYFADVQDVHDTIQKEIQQNGEYMCRFRMRKKSGEVIWVWESGSLFTDKDGEVCVRSVDVNVTNEESIRKERDTTYDNIPGGVLTLLISDSNFYIMEANQQYFEMVGSSREEYLGSSGMYTFPEDLPGLRNHLIKQAAGKKPIDYEFRAYLGKEDKFRWYRMIGRFFNEVEDGAEYMGILVDITKRRQMMFQLETEKERYRIAVGNMPGFFFEYTLAIQEMKVFGENRNNEYAPCLDEYMKGNWEDILLSTRFIHPEDYDDIVPLLKSEQSEYTKVRLLTVNRKTGEKSYQWHELKVSKIWENGAIVRIAGSARNIQKQREKELAEKELCEVYEFYMDKIFEFILRIRVSDGAMKDYFLGDIDTEPEFPGDSFEQFVLKIAERYVHPEDKEQFLKAMNLSHMQGILQSSKTQETLFFRIRWKSDEYRYKCIRYCYFGYDQKEIILNSQDVHQFKEEQIKEEQAKQRVLRETFDDARAMMEMRRNFYTMLARELRSPLMYVQSALQRMENPPDENMIQAVMYMSNVVDIIAEQEKLESGQIRLENKVFPLDEVLNRCFSLWEQKAKAIGIDFQYNVNLKWSQYYGDEAKIMQILNHVLGNCMMSSEENGSVEIWVNDRMQGDGVNKLVITAEDWGIPVSDKYFGREYPIEIRDNQRDWNLFGNRSGTAFSLIVARKLVDLMGGRMTLSRKADTSNVLSVEILLQRIAGTVMDTKIPDNTGGNEHKILNGYSLLLVRHLKREHTLSAAILQLSGANADVVSGGMQALELFRNYPENSLDAILVEANLGDMDYLEFTEQLRKEKRKDAGRIPVIAVVEEVSQDTIREGMKLGVNSWLNTPTDMKRLRLMLDAIYQGTLNM